MSDPRLDAQLKAYLEACEEERAQGKTVAALHDRVDFLTRITYTVARDRLEDRQRAARHDNRITALERQMMAVSAAPPMTDVPNWAPDPLEQTGSHNIVSLQRAQRELEEQWKAEQRKKQDTSKRWQTWLMGIAAALIVATITGCAALVVKHIVISP